MLSVVPDPVGCPGNEDRVEDDGQEQEEDWNKKSNEGDYDWSGAHGTPPRKTRAADLFDRHWYMNDDSGSRRGKRGNPCHLSSLAYTP